MTRQLFGEIIAAQLEETPVVLNLRKAMRQYALICSKCERAQSMGQPFCPKHARSPANVKLLAKGPPQPPPPDFTRLLLTIARLEREEMLFVKNRAV